MTQQSLADGFEVVIPLTGAAFIVALTALAVVVTMEIVRRRR